MKKIRDTDYLTSTMRVRALERALLSSDRAVVMVEAKTHEDAAKVLADCGYAELPVMTPAALEQLLSDEQAALYVLAGKFLPDRRMLDVFRVRYDYHNLKTLIKSEATNEPAQQLLSSNGRVNIKALGECFPDFVSKLPGDMAEAALSARDLLARSQDPQMSDFLLDRYCVREMVALSAASECKFLMDYVALFVDAVNLKSVVRADRVKKGPDFLRLVLCEGGSIAPNRLSQLLVSGGSIADLFAHTPLETAAEEGLLAMRGEREMTDFERLTDNALVSQVRKAKYTPFGPEPILAYLITRENEQTTIRTIMNGRFAGLKEAEIRERLRESYV